jgi:hypothetical protein
MNPDRGAYNKLHTENKGQGHTFTRRKDKRLFSEVAVADIPQGTYLSGGGQRRYILPNSFQCTAICAD